MPCHFRSVETGFLSGQKADDRGFPAGDAIVVAFPKPPPSSHSPPWTVWSSGRSSSSTCSCAPVLLYDPVEFASVCVVPRALVSVVLYSGGPGRAEPMPWLMGGHWHYPPWLDINYSILPCCTKDVCSYPGAWLRYGMTDECHSPSYQLHGLRLVARIFVTVDVFFSFRVHCFEFGPPSGQFDQDPISA